MEENKDILNQWKRSEKPEVPDGFFDSFANQLNDDLTDHSFIDGFKSQQQAQVPNDFFDSFPTQMCQMVDEGTHAEKSTKIIRMRWVAAVTTVAAAVLFFIFNPFQSTTENSTNLASNNNLNITVTDTTSTEDTFDYDTYLAYLDELTLVDYMLENDLKLDDETDDIAIDDAVFMEIDSELDDYYYGL